MDSESPVVALREAIGVVRSQSAFARLLGVTQQAVSRWLAEEKPLPAEHVLTAERETGVSRFRLRPDIYQDESGSADPHDRRRPLAGDGFGAMEPAR